MENPKFSLANQLLGYPPDARLLIVNADDFGMCHAVNAAIIQALQTGMVRSTTMMVPCPWSPHAMRFLEEHPEFPFGVHLTVISDWAGYRWGPVAPREQVPGLVNAAGFFYDFDQVHASLAGFSLGQLEVEFRAQIEAVLSGGLQPTHLDWHALRIGGRQQIFNVMLDLAKEYGLALRSPGPSWSQKLQGQGLPAIDHIFLDSYMISPAEKAGRFAELLRELPDGLSEWAVHPGLANAELAALDRQGAAFRQADFDFLVSGEARDILEKEGIILLDYRALQPFWRRA